MLVFWSVCFPAFSWSWWSLLCLLTAVTDTIKACVTEASQVVCTQKIKKKQLIYVFLMTYILKHICKINKQQEPICSSNVTGKKSWPQPLLLWVFQHMHDEWKDNIIYSYSCVSVLYKAVHQCAALLHSGQTPLELNSSAALVPTQLFARLLAPILLQHPSYQHLCFFPPYTSKFRPRCQRAAASLERKGTNFRILYDYAVSPASQHEQSCLPNASMLNI